MQSHAAGGSVRETGQGEELLTNWLGRSAKAGRFLCHEGKKMITRQQAEDQANACFMYNAGGFLLAAVGAALCGSRSTISLTSLWGFGVVVHAVMLYGVPDAREKILMWTAAGMENREQLQERMSERIETGVPV